MGFLAVLLTILKIIGFILAGILALILLIASLILFVPIRYHGYAKYKDKPEVLVKASYLLHIISAKFYYKDGKSDLKIKVFWHTLGSKKVRKVRKKKASSKVPAKKIEPKTEPKAEPRTEPRTEQMNKPAVKLRKKKSKKPKKQRQSFFKKIKDFCSNIKVKYGIFKEKRDEILKEINDEGNRSALNLILASIGKLLKHSLPRKHKVTVLFGTGEPDTTGELLGLMYAAAALIGINLVVTPDFENKIFECEAVFRGRIRVINVLIIVLKAYKDKNIKKLIRRARQYGR